MVYLEKEEGQRKKRRQRGKFVVPLPPLFFLSSSATFYD
jgi:hypothetical protein